MKPAVNAIIISISAGLALAALQFFMAMISGSVTVYADAWHSASDVVTSLLVLVVLGLKFWIISGQEKLKIWGDRAEHLISFSIGSIIIYMAFNVVLTAFSRSQAQIQYLWLVLASAILSVVIIFLTAYYRIRVGKNTENNLLITDGLHAISDLASTLVLIIALLGRLVGYNIEKPAAVAIAVLIFKTGLSISAQSLCALAGKSGQKPVKLLFAYLDQKAPAVWKSILWIKNRKLSAWFKKPIHWWSGRKQAIENFAEIIFAYLNKNYKSAIAVFALLFISIYLLSGFVIVPADGAGTKVIFGRVVQDSLGSGLYYVLPWPTGSIHITYPDRLVRVEVGFRTDSASGNAGEEFAYTWEYSRENARFREFPEESIYLTGDSYFLLTQMSVQYRIIEPSKYLFSVKNVDELIRYSTMACIGRIINSSGMDEILIGSRQKLEEAVKANLQVNMTEYNAGIEITEVFFRDVHPPVEVVKSFRNVASAREYRNQMVNKARGYQNELIPVARGESGKIMNWAQGEAYGLITEAEGRTAKFKLLQSVYRGAPDVVSKRMYLETAENCLAEKEKLIIRHSEIKSSQEYEKLFMFEKFFNKTPAKPEDQKP